MKLSYSFFFSFLAIILCMCNTSNAQTTIVGGNVSGVWNLSDSPYQIEGDITIVDGESLTIEPGVEVQFSGAYKLSIEGRITAIGSEFSMISFTRENSATSWNGISFSNNSSVDSSKIDYCIIEYCDSDYPGGAFYIDSFSKLKISNCIIRENQTTGGGGIACYNRSNPVIINNVIANNQAIIGGGIYCKNSSFPLIEGNLIHSNIATHSSTGGGGIRAVGNEVFVISNNVIFSNQAFDGGGIYLTGDSFTTDNTLLINNTITQNTASNEGAGMYLYDAEPVSINTIFWNNTGGEVQISTQSSDSEPQFYACNIQGGYSSISGTGTYDFDYTNPLYKNIDTAPVFEDENRQNFQLQFTSPCIDAGLTEIAGIEFEISLRDAGNSSRLSGTTVDIGAYEAQDPNPPTDIVLSSYSIEEGLVLGRVVGEFSSVDEDWGDSFTYSLVAGECDNDNSKFIIENNLLKINAPTDFELLNNFSIRVQTEDLSGLTYQKCFTINILNINEPPSFSDENYTYTVDENTTNGTLVGATHTVTDGDNIVTPIQSFTFAIIENPSGIFGINSETGQLFVEDSTNLNYEEISSLSFKIIVTDNGSNPDNLSDTALVNINISDMNDKPFFSQESYNLNISENSNVGALINSFTVTDEDIPAQNMSYTLIGATDIVDVNLTSSGCNIFVKDSTFFNFEVNNSVQFRIVVLDNGTNPAGSTDTAFINLFIDDVNDLPNFNETQYSFSINENMDANEQVGQVTVSDEDNDLNDFSFELIEHPEDVFKVDLQGNILSKTTFDYENIAHQFNLSVRVSDGQSSDTSQISIFINDANDIPEDISLTNNEIYENLLGLSVGHFSATDQDITDTHSFSLSEGNGINDLDNDKFIIEGNSLMLNYNFDYEVQNKANIHLTVEDGNGGLFEKEFIINILDIAEPDLNFIGQFTENNTVTVGDNIVTETVINNTGSETLPESEIYYILSDDDILETTDPILLTETIRELMVNAVFIQTSEVFIPANTLPGEYKLFIVSDYENLIFETDETNNSGVITLIINDESVKSIDSEIQTVNLYPNPTKGELNIIYKTEKPEEVSQIYIYNITGKCLFHEEVFNTNASLLELGHLPEGVYFVKIKIGNEVHYKEIIIEY